MSRAVEIVVSRARLGLTVGIVSGALVGAMLGALGPMAAGFVFAIACGAVGHALASELAQ